jgi:hypothetical protein
LSQKSFRLEQLEEMTNNMLFILIGFSEIVAAPDFWSPFIRKKRAKQNRFSVLSRSLFEY